MDSAAGRLRIFFTATPLVFMIAILALPALHGAVLSFDRNGPSLANYSAVLSDPFFRRALANNLIVPVGSLAIELTVGLALAMLLSSLQRGAAVIEVAAILPFAIPEIVLLTVARYIFMPRGYLNGILYAIGAPPLPWLLPNHWLAPVTVIAVDAWHITPVAMLILLAGLQTIPNEVYEAARLDGAGAWATFRHITLPLLLPAIFAVLILRGVDALRIFSTTLVLTGIEGVPVISTYSYQLWSDAQEPRLAMAASMLLALLITILSLAGFAAIRRWTAAEAAS